MALVLVTVTANFSEGDRPARGVVYFTLIRRLGDPDDEVVLEPVTREVVLDSHGALAVELATVSGVDAVYDVIENVTGAPPSRYRITVRADGSSIDLSDPALSLPGTSLVTEAGDRLVTEAGDFLVW